MIPFRPTRERVWLSIREIHRENRTERGYVIYMGPALWRDVLISEGLWGEVSLQSFFGLPVEIDPSMPRGWISLRHDVTR